MDLNFDIVAPIDSPSIRLLLQRAEADGIDSQKIWEILWLVTADCHLLAFTTAASRLLTVLDQIPSTWQSAETDAQIMSWRPVLEWVVAEEDSLTVEIGEHFSRKVNTAKHNPMRGSRSTEFPHYSVLCEPLPLGAPGDLFILLTAQMLIAHVVAMREFSSVDDYRIDGKDKNWRFLPNGLSPAALAVRRLTETKYQHFLLELSPELPPQEFAQELSEGEPLANPVVENDKLALSRFLQKVWDLLDWHGHDGGGSGGRSQGGHKWVGGRLEGFNLTIERQPGGDDDDPSTGWGTTDTVKFGDMSKRRKKARIKIDLPPDEDDEDEEVLLSDFDCSTTKPDAGAYARAARTKVRFMMRSNQLLPWDYGTLSRSEISGLHRKIDGEIKALFRIQEWTDLQTLEVEALLALEIMLWTGSDPQRTALVKTCHEATERPDADLAIVIPKDGNPKNFRWRIKVLRPDYMSEVSSTLGQIRSQATTYDLPDLIGQADAVQKLLARRPQQMVGQTLFTHGEEELFAHIKKWLKQRFPDGRITANKIQWVLWLTVHQMIGDPAIASCVTGTHHPLARVRLHYTSPWVLDIQNHYINAASSLSKHCETTHEVPGLKGDWMARSRNSSVGARLCPTLPAVRTMFTELKTDVTRTAAYSDLAGFIEHHNLLTLYTVQFFAYNTACRAIVTPYLRFDSIDTASGRASLSDKDDDFCHKTRLVWIPEPLRHHMAAYQAHLNQVKASRRHTPALLKEPCLFLGSDNQLCLVRPKLIEPLLKRYLNVEVNTHRRFLRTKLIERSCPPEIVDAFLGHWNAGEEPFGVFSSFSFDQYVSTLRVYLDPLLEEIGLTRPIVSRLVA